jgi:GAF domain-containing protein
MSNTWPGEENLSLIQRVNGALQLIPDFPETCKSILEAVIEEMDADNCSLMLRDPASNLLVLRAARGREDRRSSYYSLEFSPGKRFEVGEGVAGWVIEQGEPLMLDDVAQEPRFVDIEGSRSQVKSLICVPIEENGQIVGVFNLSRSREATFSAPERRHSANMTCWPSLMSPPRLERFSQVPDMLPNFGKCINPGEKGKQKKR